MPRHTIRALALLLAVLFALGAAPRATAEESQEQQILIGLSRSFGRVAEHAIPRTVCIRVQVGDKKGFGSGAIISPEGHILTCAHVSEPGPKLTVILADGRELPARKLGSNSRNDYAMIKIEGGPYPFFEFGESSINFKAVLSVDEFSQSYLVTHEFIKRLHKRFNEEDIIIPFPMRTLHIPDNPEITVNLRQDE